jgi:hypothetical protein
MNKLIRFAFMAVLAFLFLFFAGSSWAPVAAGNLRLGGTPMPTNMPIVQKNGSGRVAPSKEQTKLKNVIGAYFEMRYQARSASKPKGFQLSGFGSLLSNNASAKVFLKEERSKLAVEIKNAQLNQLRYVNYKYSLQFQSLTLNTSGQVATVALAEGNEVVYEISKELNPAKPIVSRTANIQHTITLRKEQGQWKIVSDRYDDDLWGALRNRRKSTAEILSATSDMLHALQTAPRSAPNKVATALAYNLPDDSSSHSYDRAGAVAYAHQHWDNSLGSTHPYNPDYYAWPSDCQNFVSQALYEGGNASMFIPYPENRNGSGDGSGPGWFYLNFLPDPTKPKQARIDQTSAAWITVGTFFDRTTIADPSILNTSQENWPETWRDAYNIGPEAIQIGGEINHVDPLPADLTDNLEIGDVVQFQLLDHPDDGTWTHSALITEKVGGLLYLTAHTNDRESEPYTDFAVAARKSRFLHIVRSNGYPPIHTQIAAVSNDAGLNARAIASKFEERGLLGGSLDREQLGAVLHEHPL